MCVYLLLCGLFALLSFDTPIISKRGDNVKQQIIVCFWIKRGIFEPEKPHKIRDFWERASSTHHKIHHHSNILILYIVFISIPQYSILTKHIHFITLYHSLPSSSPTLPHPNPIPETNKIRIHWLSPPLIPIFIHIIFPNISLIKIIILSHLSTFPITPSFSPLFNYLLTP